MKTIFLTALFFLNILLVDAQNYDLIVKANGDSIACKTDSITDMQYFFEMRIQGTWVHTSIDKSDVINYEVGTVDKRTANFKPGTTIFKPYDEDAINKNFGKSIFLEVGGKGYASANYGFRLKQHSRISLGIGIADFNADLYPTPAFMYYFLAGKKKSFFELGIGAGFAVGADFSSGVPLIYSGVIGYRYQKPGGLLFRAGITPITDGLQSYAFPSLGISIGYSL